MTQPDEKKHYRVGEREVSKEVYDLYMELPQKVEKKIEGLALIISKEEGKSLASEFETNFIIENWLEVIDNLYSRIFYLGFPDRRIIPALVEIGNYWQLSPENKVRCDKLIKLAADEYFEEDYRWDKDRLVGAAKSYLTKSLTTLVESLGYATREEDRAQQRFQEFMENRDHTIDWMEAQPYTIPIKEAGDKTQLIEAVIAWKKLKESVK